MLFFCFAFSLGVLLGSAIPELPSLLSYILFGLLLCACALGCWWRKYSWLGLILVGLAGGWFWSIGWGLWQEHYELPVSGEDWIVEGRIANLPKYQQRRVRFNFAVEDMIPLSAARESPAVKKLRISWYGMPAGTQLLPGQKWRFTIRAFRPHSFMNPGGFDYERWLLQNGIQGSGYVRQDASLLQPARGYFFARLRMSIRNRIERIPASSQSQGIINALMIGDRSHLADETWQVLLRTGISHLIAISGLHITLVGGLIFFLALGFFNLLPWKLSSLRSAAFLALGVIWFYAFSVGFSVPTQRATLMLSVLFLTTVFMRRPQLLLSYALALALVLLVHPLAGFNGGFYLSFVAAAIILLLGRYLFTPRFFPSRLARARHYFVKLCLLQLLLVLCLTPFTLLFFHAFSPLGFFVNLIAIPVTSFILMPWIIATWLLLFLIPSLGSASIALLAAVIERLYIPLEWLAAQDGSFIHLGQPSLWVIALALIGMAVFLFQSRPSFYFLASLFFLPLFFPPSSSPAEGSVQVSFLDVGQGLAVHIRTATHNLLYDVGPRYSASFNAGSGIIVPYLHSYGITRLDRIIISHQDMDHRGGLTGLLKHIKVASLMLSFRHSDMKSYEWTQCIAGEQWRWDGVFFQVLHPPAGYATKEKDKNNTSCVLLVSIGKKRLLLTGDIEKEVEDKLHQELGELKLAILQVPHHGSSSSSHLEWIRSIRPDYAVFSAGFGNAFSHPAREVMERYADSARLITWQTGAAQFRMNDQEVVYMGGERARTKRYWHGNFRNY